MSMKLLVPAVLILILCVNKIHGIYPETPMFWCSYLNNGNYWYSLLCGDFVDVNNDGLIDVVQSWVEGSPPNQQANAIFLNNGCGWIVSTAYNESVIYCNPYLESKMNDDDRVIRRVLELEEQGVISETEALKLLKAIVGDAIGLLSRNIEDHKKFIKYALAIVN